MSKLNRLLKKHKKQQTTADTGSAFTSMALENGNTFDTTSQNPDNNSTALCHLSCETLNYGVFLRILKTNDVRLLIISGEHSIQSLRKVWEGIVREFSDLIKTEQSDSVFMLWKKIEYTRWKLMLADESCRLLKSYYDKDVAEMLSNLGFDLVELKDGDWASYHKQIEGIETEAKSLVVLLNQYYREYQIANPEKKNVPERTDIDYEKELAVLSKYMGYRLRKEELTVLEFCSIANIYLEQIKK